MADDTRFKYKAAMEHSTNNSASSQTPKELNKDYALASDRADRALWNDFFGIDRKAHQVIRLIDKSNTVHSSKNNKMRIINLFSKKIFELPPRLPEPKPEEEIVELVRANYALQKNISDCSILLDKKSGSSLLEVSPMPNTTQSRFSKGLNLPKVISKRLPGSRGKARGPESEVNVNNKALSSSFYLEKYMLGAISNNKL